MDSKELPASTESNLNSNSSGEALQGNRSATALPPAQKRTKVEPIPGDLTSRLVNIALWFSFGTTIGLVSQMAVTRRTPNLGAGAAIGVTAAVVCSFKDLEGLRISPSLLNKPRKSINRFETRLDEHSGQLADNTASQESLVGKIDGLAERVDALTLTMARLPVTDSSHPGRFLNREVESEAPPAIKGHHSATNEAQLNGNGQSGNSLGAGFH